jgi:polysaccharide export outer membrane protein
MKATKRLLNRVITIALAVSTALLAHAQSADKYSNPVDLIPPQAEPIDLQRHGPQTPQPNSRYLVKVDDSVALTFPMTPEFNQILIVQPDGFINPGGAASLHVEGLTVPQVADAVKDAYAHVLHNPVVLVDLKDFQQPIFSVLGQVGKPGQYPLRYDTTIAEAIALGGGMLPTGKTQVFLLRRTSTDQMQVHQYKVDFTGNHQSNEMPRLRPGDIVFVPEKAIVKFRKYVPYYLGLSLNDASFF